MEDKPKSKRGGSLPRGITQTAVPLKLDNDLRDWLNDYDKEKRNRFINVAVRERVERLKAMLNDVDSLSEDR